MNTSDRDPCKTEASKRVLMLSGFDIIYPTAKNGTKLNEPTGLITDQPPRLNSQLHFVFIK